MNIYSKDKLNPWTAIWFAPRNTLKYLFNSKEFNSNIWKIYIYMIPMQIVYTVLLVFNLLPDKKMILFLREPSEYIYGFVFTPLIGIFCLYFGSWLYCKIEKHFGGTVERGQIQIIVLWSVIIPLTFNEFIQGIMIWIFPRNNPFGDCIVFTLIIWFLSIVLCGIMELNDISFKTNVAFYVITLVVVLIYRFLMLSMLSSDYTTILMQAG